MILPGAVVALSCGCPADVCFVRPANQAASDVRKNALHLRPAEAYHYPSGVDDATGATTATIAVPAQRE